MPPPLNHRGPREAPYQVRPLLGWCNARSEGAGHREGEVSGRARERSCVVSYSEVLFWDATFAGIPLEAIVLDHAILATAQ